MLECLFTSKNIQIYFVPWTRKRPSESPFIFETQLSVRGMCRANEERRKECSKDLFEKRSEGSAELLERLKEVYAKSKQQRRTVLCGVEKAQKTF